VARAAAEQTLTAALPVAGTCSRPATAAIDERGGWATKQRHLSQFIGGEVSPPTPQETRLGDKPQSGFLFEAQFLLAGKFPRPPLKRLASATNPKSGFLFEAQFLLAGKFGVDPVQWTPIRPQWP
jgi:hypothetical protein